MDTKAIQNLMNKAHSAVPTAAPGAGLREAVMGFGVVPGVAMASIPLAAAVAVAWSDSKIWIECAVEVEDQ